MIIERPQSLTKQVNTILRQRIRDGVYAPSTRLPAESELAHELQVSRATVRTVMAKLAVEGLVLRKQGDGTYVNEQADAINTNDGGMFHFTRLIENSGYLATIQPIAATVRPATLVEQQQLNIPAGDLLLSLKRLFLADKQPAIVATNLIPTTLLTHPAESLDVSLTLQKILKKYCRYTIAYGTYKIEPAFATPPITQQLNVKNQTPLLYLTVTFYTQNNQPFVLGKSYFNHEILPLRFMQTWT